MAKGKKPNFRIFVRRDNKNKISDFVKITKTPAQHMNFYGEANWVNTGYISLFEYCQANKIIVQGAKARKFMPACGFHISKIPGKYIHYLLVPAKTEITKINSITVEEIPKREKGTPLLISTAGVSPPSKINEDGLVMARANRDICEFLLAGMIPDGSYLYSEYAGSITAPPLLKAMKSGLTYKEIAKKIYRKGKKIGLPD